MLGACWAQQAAAVAVQRRTMVYMYCGPDPNQGNHSGDAACDERTSVALSHASSISTLVLGSHLCRLPEYASDESSASWCDYQANYSAHIAQLRHAGVGPSCSTPRVPTPLCKATGGGRERRCGANGRAGACGERVRVGFRS